MVRRRPPADGLNQAAGKGIPVIADPGETRHHVGIMPDAALINASVGPYILRELIAVGGTAEVYRATHRDDARSTYAVKVIRSEMRGDAAKIKAFADEFALLRRFSHPGIPQAWRYGEVQGRAAMVMGYMSGQNLGQACRTGKVEDPVGIFLGMVEAVAYLHDQRVLHHDLKLDNMLVDGQGRVGLVDFGNAREKAEAGLLARLFRRTPTQIFATPTYVAPELLRGSHPDFASDIYSLGVCGWILFTGRPPPTTEPNQRQTPVTTADHELFRRAHPGLDPRIASLVKRCTLIDPKARFADAPTLAANLAQLPAIAARKPRG